jgi:pyruvate formate lyase activating enzyme
MKIGSINKTSLLDYPAKLSAMIGAQGCNMRCPYCHNFYLIPYEFTKHSQIIKEEEFFSFLHQRKNFLDGVVITGGEPTIQSDLPEFCDNVKKIGFSVKLDTNGTNPSVLSRLLKNGLVDYIAMDIKTDLDQYNQLFKENIDVNEILKSIDIIMSSDQPYEFRTTCVSPFVTKNNIDQIGILIKGAKSFFLQKCNPPKHMVNSSKYEIVNENYLLGLKQRADSYVLNCKIR